MRASKLQWELPVVGALASACRYFIKRLAPFPRVLVAIHEGRVLETSCCAWLRWRSSGSYRRLVAGVCFTSEWIARSEQISVLGSIDFSVNQGMSESISV